MDKDKILFVEGENDKQVIYRIENAYSLRDICQVEKCNNVDQAKLSFDLYINENASKVQSVGIIIDADTSFIDRWKSVRNLLVATKNYIVPDALPAGGLILDSTTTGKPRVGVWIMPNNRDNGMLEDFLLQQIPQEDDVLPFVDETLGELKVRKIQKFKDVHISKARAHTYLAWQEDPECTLAIAIEKNYFASNFQDVEAFAAWMQNLYK